MNRIIILGGLGGFGQETLKALSEEGIQALTASRSAQSDLQVDVEDANSLDSTLRQDDILIDTVGPFQNRSTTLLNWVIEHRASLIDINDSLTYAQQVYNYRSSIDASGALVLNSFSTVSAISSLIIQLSGIERPHSFASFLAPASKHTARTGTARSLIRSLGHEVWCRQKGQLRKKRGWADSKRFRMPPPLNLLHAYRFESADAFLLPLSWPELQDIDMFIDSNTLGLNSILCLGKQFPPLRFLLYKFAGLGTKLARLVGSQASGIGYRIESHSGEIQEWASVSTQGGQRIAVAPVVVALKKILTQDNLHRGYRCPQEFLDPSELQAYLTKKEIPLAPIEA